MWLASLPAGPGFGGLWRFYVAGAVSIVAAVFAANAFRRFAAAKTSVNPIRLALLLMTLFFVLGHWWAALGPLAFAAFITRFQILPEERVLAARYGSAYDDYRKRVRRWI
jgi:protein-S-isoprenylcysteine O-methyltransferase Ste14